MNINYTECLTQLWMLLLFGEHIAGHQVILECDNLWTVQALHEHRARKLAGAILLEKIDTAAALIYCEPFWLQTSPESTTALPMNGTQIRTIPLR